MRNIQKDNKKKVFLTEYIHPTARELLEEHVEVISDMRRISEVEGLIDRNEISVTKELLDKATNLKVVAVHGTGMDAVDLEEAKKHGVEVFSTPGINARSVAELNLAFSLLLSRRICEANQAIIRGENVSHEKQTFEGHEVTGKTYGFIGMGNIARITAQMVKNGLNANVIAWSRSLTLEKAKKLGITFCSSKEEVLQRADIIIMGLALNKDTLHIIGEKELRMCKPDAVFINTARGRLVDEQALYQALKEGWISAAASDVFEQEPVTNKNQLVGLSNFLATPHLGANTEEALYRVGMAVVTGVLDRLGIEYLHNGE